MTENSLLSYAVDSIISEAESRLSIDAESFNLTKFFYEDLWIDFVHTHHKEQLLSIAEIDSKIVFNQIINKFEEVVDKVSGNADPTCYDFILFALYHALLEISGSNGYTIALAPLLSKILKLAIFAQVTFGIPNRLTNGCISSLNYFQNLGANLIPEIMMDAFQSGKNCETLDFSYEIYYATTTPDTFRCLLGGIGQVFFLFSIEQKTAFIEQFTPLFSKILTKHPIFYQENSNIEEVENLFYNIYNMHQADNLPLLCCLLPFCPSIFNPQHAKFVGILDPFLASASDFKAKKLRKVIQGFIELFQASLINSPQLTEFIKKNKPGFDSSFLSRKVERNDQFFDNLLPRYIALETAYEPSTPSKTLSLCTEKNQSSSFRNAYLEALDLMLSGYPVKNPVNISKESLLFITKKVSTEQDLHSNFLKLCIRGEEFFKLFADDKELFTALIQAINSFISLIPRATINLGGKYFRALVSFFNQGKLFQSIFSTMPNGTSLLLSIVNAYKTTSDFMIINRSPANLYMGEIMNRFWQFLNDISPNNDDPDLVMRVSDILLYLYAVSDFQDLPKKLEVPSGPSIIQEAFNVWKQYVSQFLDEELLETKLNFQPTFKEINQAISLLSQFCMEDAFLEEIWKILAREDCKKSGLFASFDVISEDIMRMLLAFAKKKFSLFTPNMQSLNLIELLIHLMKPQYFDEYESLIGVLIFPINFGKKVQDCFMLSIFDLINLTYTNARVTHPENRLSIFSTMIMLDKHVFKNEGLVTNIARVIPLVLKSLVLTQVEITYVLNSIHELYKRCTFPPVVALLKQSISVMLEANFDSAWPIISFSSHEYNFLFRSILYETLEQFFFDKSKEWKNYIPQFDFSNKILTAASLDVAAAYGILNKVIADNDSDLIYTTLLHMACDRSFIDSLPHVLTGKKDFLPPLSFASVFKAVLTKRANLSAADALAKYFLEPFFEDPIWYRSSFHAKKSSSALVSQFICQKSVQSFCSHISEADLPPIFIFSKNFQQSRHILLHQAADMLDNFKGAEGNEEELNILRDSNFFRQTGPNKYYIIVNDIPITKISLESILAFFMLHLDMSGMEFTINLEGISGSHVTLFKTMMAKMSMTLGDIVSKVVLVNPPQNIEKMLEDLISPEWKGNIYFQRDPSKGNVIFNVRAKDEHNLYFYIDHFEMVSQATILGQTVSLGQSIQYKMIKKTENGENCVRILYGRDNVNVLEIPAQHPKPLVRAINQFQQLGNLSLFTNDTVIVPPQAPAAILALCLYDMFSSDARLSCPSTKLFWTIIDNHKYSIGGNGFPLNPLQIADILVKLNLLDDVIRSAILMYPIKEVPQLYPMITMYLSRPAIDPVSLIRLFQTCPASEVWSFVKSEETTRLAIPLILTQKAPFVIIEWLAVFNADTVGHVIFEQFMYPQYVTTPCFVSPISASSLIKISTVFSTTPGVFQLRLAKALFTFLSAMVTVPFNEDKVFLNLILSAVKSTKIDAQSQVEDFKSTESVTDILYLSNIIAHALDQKQSDIMKGLFANCSPKENERIWWLNPVLTTRQLVTALRESVTLDSICKKQATYCLESLGRIAGHDSSSSISTVLLFFPALSFLEASGINIKKSSMRLMEHTLKFTVALGCHLSYVFDALLLSELLDDSVYAFGQDFHVGFKENYGHAMSTLLIPFLQDVILHDDAVNLLHALIESEDNANIKVYFEILDAAFADGNMDDLAQKVAKNATRRNKADAFWMIRLLLWLADKDVRFGPVLLPLIKKRPDLVGMIKKQLTEQCLKMIEKSPQQEIAEMLLIATNSVYDAEKIIVPIDFEGMTLKDSQLAPHITRVLFGIEESLDRLELNLCM